MFNKVISLCNVITLLVFPFSSVFPQTRTLSVRWSKSTAVYDLGYNDNVSDVGSILLESTAKHNYSIQITYYINCNSACLLSPVNAAYGYNVDENNIIATRGFVFTGTSDEVKAQISGMAMTGYNTASKLYETGNEVGNVLMEVTTINNETWSITVAFPGMTEGTLLKDLSSNINSWHTEWLTWEAYDTEQKIHQINQWIYDMYMRQALPSTITQAVQNALDNSDPDTAYSVITNYYNSQLSETNTAINSNVNNNDANTNIFNSNASQEQQIASAQESQFDTAINQIDTTNPLANLSDFSNAATWVRAQFDTLTTNNAFGTLLGFTLLLGLALAIVGRIL